MKHTKQKLIFANYLLQQLTDLTLKHDLHLISNQQYETELSRLIQDINQL